MIVNYMGKYLIITESCSICRTTGTLFISYARGKLKSIFANGKFPVDLVIVSFIFSIGVIIRQSIR